MQNQKMHEWIATVPAAHACTLLVAAHHHKQIENDWEVESKQSNYENLEQYVIEWAWELLVRSCHIDLWAGVQVCSKCSY